MKPENRTAYEIGVQAAKTNLTVDDNPYGHKDTDNAEAWFDGWMEESNRIRVSKERKEQKGKRATP